MSKYNQLPSVFNREQIYSLFDVVICRNLLIYYNSFDSKLITERLANITNKFLILGISDPFNFLIKDNKITIGNNLFKVVDFDNRIFKRIK